MRSGRQHGDRLGQQLDRDGARARRRRREGVPDAQLALLPFEGEAASASGQQRRRACRRSLQPGQHVGARLGLEVDEIEQAIARIGRGRQLQLGPGRGEVHDLGEQAAQPDLLPVDRQADLPRAPRPPSRKARARQLRLVRPADATLSIAAAASARAPMPTASMNRRRPQGPRAMPTSSRRRSLLPTAAGDLERVAGDAERACDVVGTAQRQDRDRQVPPAQVPNDLDDRAVAARHHDQIRRLAERLR